MEEFELTLLDVDSSFAIRHILAFVTSEDEPKEDMSLSFQTIPLEPSRVLLRLSHISFAETHFETLKNSLESRAYIITFLAMQSS